MKEAEFLRQFEPEFTDADTRAARELASLVLPGVDAENANKHELLMSSPWISLDALDFHESYEIEFHTFSNNAQTGRLYVELLPWRNQTEVPSGEAVRAQVLSSSLQTFPVQGTPRSIVIQGGVLGEYMPQNGVIRRDCGLSISRMTLVPFKKVYPGATRPPDEAIAAVAASGVWERDPKTNEILVPWVGTAITLPPVMDIYRITKDKSKEEKLDWQPASTFNSRSE